MTKQEPRKRAWCYDISLSKKDGYEPSVDAFEPTLAVPGPACAGCGEPMLLFALLHKHPERLPLKQHAAIGVFLCARDPGDAFDDWWKHCAVANPDSKGGRLAVLYDEAPKLARNPHVAHYMHKEDLESDDDFAGDDDDERGPNRGSKLGGEPWWSSAIDPPTTLPECSHCQKSMPFIAQVSEGSPLTFTAGDGFTGYVYLCPEEHEARLDAFVD